MRPPQLCQSCAALVSSALGPQGLGEHAADPPCCCGAGLAGWPPGTPGSSQQAAGPGHPCYLNSCIENYLNSQGAPHNTAQPRPHTPHTSQHSLAQAPPSGSPKYSLASGLPPHTPPSNTVQPRPHTQPPAIPACPLHPPALLCFPEVDGDTSPPELLGGWRVMCVMRPCVAVPGFSGRWRVCFPRRVQAAQLPWCQGLPEPL
ncbi:hypothetical protein P7K49_003290 [Saguinus oedipus]|uniref:Uncharacterized protein n=1 Tax=Saguinus oedipus TaxID=9490 RepID=A0ABQ9WJS3_SAGOE|nr:hypothetical protein P7K49_003290 [Saguinus oedipus]